MSTDLGRTRTLDIWLFQIGEPLPTDSGRPRVLRAGILAEELARRGHRVTWWATTFSHIRKSYDFDRETVVEAKPGLTVHALHGRPYRRNISVARLLNHHDLTKGFKKAAPTKAKPHVIVASMPSLDLAAAAVAYAQANGVPSAIDIRDLWPDAWTYVLPRAARPLARLALTPFYAELSSALRGATGILGISELFLDWGLGHSGRARGAWDRVFAMAYQRPSYSDAEQAEAETFWRARGVIATPQPRIACFVGNLSRRSARALVGIAKAFCAMPQSVRREWRLVLCGTGDLVPELQEAASREPGIILPGWINAVQIWTLMRRSMCGLIPYENVPDLLAGYPNKFGEYLSAGLPILSLLRGAVGESIQRNNCGWVSNGPVHAASAFEDIARDQNAWNAKSAAAAALFSREFDARVVYRDHADYVERLAAAAA